MSGKDARKWRSQNQRLFLVDQGEKGGGGWLFVVLGSTGNRYDVVLENNGKISACTCPDHKVRGNKCKHIYFIRDRVLGGVSKGDRCQKAAEKPSAFRVPQQVVDEYSTANKKGVVRRDWIGQECAICIEEMTEGGEETVFCRTTCGNSLHRQCFEMWKSRKGDTCVYCRSSFG